MNKAIVKCFDTVYSWITRGVVFTYLIFVLPIFLVQLVKSGNPDAVIISFLRLTLKLTEWLSYHKGKIICILYSKNNLQKYYTNICREKKEKYEEFQKISPLDMRATVTVGLTLSDLKMYAFAVEDSGKLPQSVAKSDPNEEDKI